MQTPEAVLNSYHYARFGTRCSMQATREAALYTSHRHSQLLSHYGKEGTVVIVGVEGVTRPRGLPQSHDPGLELLPSSQIFVEYS